MRPCGLMFHHFARPGVSPAQGELDAAAFSALLDTQRGLLPARDWLDRALTGGLEPHHRCITLDDGLASQIDVARPVLAARGLTAFWFVHSAVLEGGRDRLELYRHFRMTAFGSLDDFYSAFERAAGDAGLGEHVRRGLEHADTNGHLAAFPFYTPADRRFRYLRDVVLGPSRYHAVMDRMMAGWDASPSSLRLWLTPDDVRTLVAEGHVIGLHSHTHPTNLAGMPFEAQRAEYAQNAAVIERLTGERAVVAAHPCNSYSPATLVILRNLGVRLAFRSNTEPFGTSMLEWPREDAANLHAPRATRRKEVAV